MEEGYDLPPELTANLYEMTAEERLASLRKMYSLLPKHKASEKLQAELKTKISDARDACEKEQAKARKGGGKSS